VHGELRAGNEFHPEIKWDYHVAPLVFVRTDSGKVEPRIIDLSFNPDRAQRFGEWVAKFNPLNERIQIDIAHHKQVSPPSTRGYTAFDFETELTAQRKDLRERRASFEELRGRMAMPFFNQESVPTS
jgi:hypothetical protein